MEVCMKSILSAAFCLAAFALMSGPAPGLEDHICRGQDSFTGVALNALTIETPRFLCNGRDVREGPPTAPHMTLPPLIHLQFKDADVQLKPGDTVTLTGKLYNVNDHHLQEGGWLLADAQITQTVPAADSSPTPGSEAALHRYIDSLEKGMPNYDEMEPRLTRAVYQRTPWLSAYIKQVGALKALRFLFADQSGNNVYRADFEHGSAEWLIAPLSDAGKVRMQGFLPLPASLDCGSEITYMADPYRPVRLLPWQCQQFGGDHSTD
jgi:hypothetical protein